MRKFQSSSAMVFSPGNGRGYTFMEILTVIMVIAVLATITVPAVDNFNSGQRVAAEAMLFIQDVRLGRNLAVESQVYHRINFKADGTYTVDQYDNPSWTHLGAVEDSTADALPGSTNWTNVLEEPYREFSPEVTFQRPVYYSTIFFRPDGMLVSNPSESGMPIADTVATFTYGAATLQVCLNSTGVFASEEYYEE